MGSKIITLDINLLKEIGFQILSTLILFYALSKLLYKPVSNFLNKRKEGIVNEIEEANNLKAEAIKMKEEYEAKINSVNKEADEILAHAHKKASDGEMEILKEAREQAESMKKRAEKDVEMAKNQVKEDMKREIIEIANVMTKKIVNVTVDESKHKDLIQQATEEIGDAKWLA